MNRRILIVDDNPAIHEDYRKILGSAGSGGLGELDPLELEILDLGDSAGEDELYSLDFAIGGQQALEMLIQAQQAGSPYAMAFVDMRMPPGWDGLETVERFWQNDPRLQVVICSAYSDYSWDELQSRVRRNDNLLLISKPFDMMEIRQAAAALTLRRHSSESTQAEIQELKRRLESQPGSPTAPSIPQGILFEGAPVALITINANLCVRALNGPARHLLGAEASSRLGQPLSTLTCDGSYLPVGSHLRMARGSEGKAFPARFCLSRVVVDSEPHYICAILPLDVGHFLLGALPLPHPLKARLAPSRAPQPCCLNSLVRIATHLFQRLKATEGKVELQLTPSLPLVEGDPEEVLRVLLHLLIQTQLLNPPGDWVVATGRQSSAEQPRLWAGLVTPPPQPAPALQASCEVDLPGWRLLLPLPSVPQV